MKLFNKYPIIKRNKDGSIPRECIEKIERIKEEELEIQEASIQLLRINKVNGTNLSLSNMINFGSILKRINKK